MKKLNITKERFEKSRYFQRKYGKLEYVSESGNLYKTNKGKVLKFNESLDGGTDGYVATAKESKDSIENKSWFLAFYMCWPDTSEKPQDCAMFLTREEAIDWVITNFVEPVAKDMELEDDPEVSPDAIRRKLEERDWAWLDYDNTVFVKEIKFGDPKF